jgi:hypothetical protein
MPLRFMYGHSIALLTKLRGDRCLSHIGREGQVIANEATLMPDLIPRYSPDTKVVRLCGSAAGLRNSCRIAGHAVFMLGNSLIPVAALKAICRSLGQAAGAP